MVTDGTEEQVRRTVRHLIELPRELRDWLMQRAENRQGLCKRAKSWSHIPGMVVDYSDLRFRSVVVSEQGMSRFYDNALRGGQQRFLFLREEAAPTRRAQAN
jgi:hypothetical protein